jgi:hypothetical protein
MSLGCWLLISAAGRPVSAWAREKDNDNAYGIARAIRYRAHRFRYREPEHGHRAQGPVVFRLSASCPFESSAS